MKKQQNQKREWKKIDIFAKKIKAVNLLGGKCEECGETNIFVLEFHHINKQTKERAFWDLKNLRWSKIEEEIKKCILLCGNCHNKFHFENENDSRWKHNKKIFLEYKGIKGCEKCGYNQSNASLDFHHKNIDDKDFMIGEISIKYNSIYSLTEKIENELNKCEVLCKNCHKLEHADIEFFEKRKDKILEKSKKIKEIIGKIDRKIVKNLYENGMKQIEIANYFNATKGTISHIITELGIRK